MINLIFKKCVEEITFIPLFIAMISTRIATHLNFEEKPENLYIASSEPSHWVKSERHFQDTDWGEVWTEHKVQNFLQGQLSSFEVA